MHEFTKAAARRGYLSLLGALALIATACKGTETSEPVPPHTTPSALPIRGLYVQFERRGWSTEYWSGQVLQRFDSVDAVVGTAVAAEVGLQLGLIHSFGVNTIAFELRAADSLYLSDGFKPPTCNIPPVLGLRWPQPAPHELANLVAFFDLVQNKGLHVLLRLVNTHMEERPPTNSATWLGAILAALRNHPALDLVLFEGAPHVVDNGSGPVCGIPAEPPLWEGLPQWRRSMFGGLSATDGRSASDRANFPPRRSLGITSRSTEAVAISRIRSGWRKASSTDCRSQTASGRMGSLSTNTGSVLPHGGYPAWTSIQTNGQTPPLGTSFR